MIKGYTLDQIKQFYSSTYGAGRARLYVVGNFDPASVEASIRKAFAGWTKGTPPSPETPKPTSVRAIHLIDRPDEPSLGVGEGMAGPTAAAIANAVYNAIGVRVRDLPITRERIVAAMSL